MSDFACLAWRNGELLTYAQAQLTENGWPAGSGLFETIKTVNGLPWALSRHMRRALNSARRNNLAFPAEELIRKAVSEVIAANPFPTGRLRLLFQGNTLIATHQEYLELTGAAKLMAFAQVIDSSTLIEKKFPYDQNLKLLENARANGFDDGILFNDRGNVTETAVSNLLLQIDGKWVTPPLSDGVLPGVVRALIIERNEVRVREISQADLVKVTAGFLISSLKIAQPISQIDAQILAISPESEQMRLEIAATALTTSVG